MNTSKVSIGLVNPKSPDNVGSVMRAAGNYRVDSVYYCGPRYPRALERNPRLVDTARKVSVNIPLKGVDSLVGEIAKGLAIVCIEFAEGAQPLTTYPHPQDALYIFGPEDGTIDQDIIDQADAVVYIPTVGCMNLAATVNVVLYDRLAKSSETFNSETLILESRDTNNKIKANRHT